MEFFILTGILAIGFGTVAYVLVSAFEYAKTPIERGSR